MSRTTATTADLDLDTEELTLPTSPADPMATAPQLRRSPSVIESDLTAARQRLANLEQINSAYHTKRERRALRRKEWMDRFAREHPDDPTPDEEEVPSSCLVGPKDSPVGKEFYDLHYRVEEFEIELAQAKKSRATY